MKIYVKLMFLLLFIGFIPKSVVANNSGYKVTVSYPAKISWVKRGGFWDAVINGNLSVYESEFHQNKVFYKEIKTKESLFDIIDESYDYEDYITKTYTKIRQPSKTIESKRVISIRKSGTTFLETIVCNIYIDSHDCYEKIANI